MVVMMMVMMRGTSTSSAATGAASAVSLVGGAADLEDLVLKRDDDGMFARVRRCADDGPSPGREVVALDRLIQEVCASTCTCRGGKDSHQRCQRSQVPRTKAQRIRAALRRYRIAIDCGQATTAQGPTPFLPHSRATGPM